MSIRYSGIYIVDRTDLKATDRRDLLEIDRRPVSASLSQLFLVVLSLRLLLQEVRQQLQS